MNGKTLLIAACLLGASLLAAAALLGEPSQKGHRWMPMNESMAEKLAEKHAANGKVDGVGGRGSPNDHPIEDSNVESGQETISVIGVSDPARFEAEDGQPREGSGGGAASETSGKIDINRANAAQLNDLKGIGPAKAQAIVNDREKNGPFRSIEDLLRVKGIGEKLLASIKESVVALP